MKLAILLMFFGLPWQQKEGRGFSLYFQEADRTGWKHCRSLIEKGRKTVGKFFHRKFQQDFEVYLHPNRRSLDSSWEKDWKMPGFKSECWMVASGVANRLDLVSPRSWPAEACDHGTSEEELTLILTHELVHVFHAQQNPSKDFGNTEGIDWFVEGLAVYASGQLTPVKIQEVQKAAAAGQTPTSLDDFWKGKLRYQLSGSIVAYIDQQYGRNKLAALLSLTKKSEVLAALAITENELIEAWKHELEGGNGLRR